MLAVVLDVACFSGFEEGGNDEERGVEDAHDDVIEVFVAVGGEPPFEGEDEEEDFNEIECCGGSIRSGSVVVRGSFFLNACMQRGAVEGALLMRVTHEL